MAGQLLDGANVAILLTSVDAFTSALRLLWSYLHNLVTAKRNSDEALVAALSASLADLAKLVAEVEKHAELVDLALDRQATVLRDGLFQKVCARARDILGASQRRLASGVDQDDSAA